MNTPTKVYEYYWKIYETLPPYEQFHFISRLFLVKGDIRAKNEIEKLKKTYDTLTQQEVWDDLQKKLTNTATINHAESRKVFLEKYPTIRKNARDLFTYFFAKKLFNIDLQKTLRNEMTDEWDSTTTALLADVSAVKELSAYVINFVLLYTHYKEGNTDSEITTQLYELSKEIYTSDSDSQENEMWIYFLTHLIIGDTLFYIAPLCSSKRELYAEMIHHLQKSIERRYFEIHLDCKLEFLVCSHLTGSHSYLEDVILSEASESLSMDGDFVIDIYTSNKQLHRTTAITSEHRNVLFLLAFYEKIDQEVLNH